MEPVSKPLLSIGIPTFERAAFLRQNLKQLKSQIRDFPKGHLEIIVSDNCSQDDTKNVVKELCSNEMPIRYIRNKKNLGWALNFAQVFDNAKAEYILMMGDDDALVDGALAIIYKILNGQHYGVVGLRPFGYDSDFKKEQPKKALSLRKYRDDQKFLIATQKFFTLTSALILNKRILAGVNSKEFVNTDLATFHLMLRAALSAETNLLVEGFLVGSKRQNSFSYEYVDVFVDQFWHIIDSHEQYGLDSRTIRRLEFKRLWSYYPLYMLDIRVKDRGRLDKAKKSMIRRFNGHLLYHFWVEPILTLPKYLAFFWGWVTIFLGRVFSGDAQRGLKFFSSFLGIKFKRMFE